MAALGKFNLLFEPQVKLGGGGHLLPSTSTSTMSSRSSHESDREEDSSDDDMEVSGSEASINVDDLPSIVKDNEAVAAKLKKARQSKVSDIQRI
jgi:hypothetical protein